jgi:hypothetical protein
MDVVTSHWLSGVIARFVPRMTLRILIYINLPVFRFRSFIDYALTVSALQGSQAETLDRSENIVS